MIFEKPNFFVLTGGPGAGKTTLLHALAQAGEIVVGESARDIIREQVGIGGDATPWNNPTAFAEAMARRDTETFDAMIGETRRVFFDRGVIDAYGANGVTPSPLVREAVRTRRYNRRVFIAPPWREIYETDAERRQDWAQAQATFDQMMSRLPRLGYAPVVLPKTDVRGRVAFVLAEID